MSSPLLLGSNGRTQAVRTGERAARTAEQRAVGRREAARADERDAELVRRRIAERRAAARVVPEQLARRVVPRAQD